MTASRLRTPDEWCDLLGVQVLDPDGWDRSDFERSWAEPISRLDFERRLMVSTISTKVLD